MKARKFIVVPIPVDTPEQIIEARGLLSRLEIPVAAIYQSVRDPRDLDFERGARLPYPVATLRAADGRVDWSPGCEPAPRCSLLVSLHTKTFSSLE